MKEILVNNKALTNPSATEPKIFSIKGMLFYALEPMDYINSSIAYSTPSEPAIAIAVYILAAMLNRS